MSDLRVNAAQLCEVSTRITAAASQMRFTGALSDAADGVLGSSDVSSALREDLIQQRSRAELTADALRTAGLSPAQAVVSFTEADSALAGAF